MQKSFDDSRSSKKPWQQLAFLLGEAALALASNGVLFIVVSRVAGPELLGTYALAFAWLMLFQGVSSFGIPEFLMREVGAYGRGAATQVNHALLLGLGSGVTAICLMLGVSRLLGYSPEMIDVIAVASLALIPTFINTACRSVFLALREMHLTFFALLAEVAILMSGSLYALLNGHGALGLMIALVVSKVTSASIALSLLYIKIIPERPRINSSNLIETARTVFTFGLGNVLGMLSMRINTIMVSIWVDLATVGQYAAATKIMEIGLMIPNLFAQLLMTRVAYSFATQGDRDPNKFGAWFQVLFAIIVPSCVGGWVFAELILKILFGANFGHAAWVLRILMIYLAIETLDAVMSVILKAAQRQRDDISCLAFNPLVNILLNFALLPALGTIGAALGRLGGGAMSSSLRHIVIARKLHRIEWLHFAFRPLLISLTVGILCGALLRSEPPLLLLAFYVVVTPLLLKFTSSFSFAAIKDMMSAPSA